MGRSCLGCWWAESLGARYGGPVGWVEAELVVSLRRCYCQCHVEDFRSLLTHGCREREDAVPREGGLQESSSNGMVWPGIVCNLVSGSECVPCKSTRKTGKKDSRATSVHFVQYVPQTIVTSTPSPASTTKTDASPDPIGLEFRATAALDAAASSRWRQLGTQ